MKFGLFSNGQRYNQIARDTYQQDLEEIILADELGMSEAWISEHGSLMTFNAPDQMPCADLLICKALSLTKQIKMGPGIRPLPFFHPLQVATDCAVCDHLADGRYMAGFGLGLAAHQHEPRGKLPGPPRDMALESIDLILKAWESPEPFDWDGKYWQGKNWKIIPKPLTKPRMDVGLACSKSDSSLEVAAMKGFFPMLTWHQRPAELAKMAQTFINAPYADIQPTRERIRVCRYLYVSDSKASARRELKDADVGAAKANRLNEYIPKGGSRDDLTMELLIDEGVLITGDPDDVSKRLMEVYEEIGGFGTVLMVCGKDWGTWEQRQRSWRAIMKHVAPRFAGLNGAMPARATAH